MFGYLILLFTILPALELALLIKVGGHIGLGNTLMVIILTGVVGAYLARLQGFLVLRKIQDSLNQGQMPSAQLLDGLMILAGGILLLTPGFVTDALGFLLLVPWTRALIKMLLNKKFEAMVHKGQAGGQMHSFGPSQKHFDDIDI